MIVAHYNFNQPIVIDGDITLTIHAVRDVGDGQPYAVVSIDSPRSVTVASTRLTTKEGEQA